MKPNNKTPGGPGKVPPQWLAVLWYLPVMLFLLWMWQQAFSNLAVRTIPYSEFKTYLEHDEVPEVMVKTDTIEGKIVPHAAAPSHPAAASETNAKTGTNAATAQAAPEKPFLFRTVRVDDPYLEEQLEAAHVKFSGTRPGFFSEFLFA